MKAVFSVLGFGLLAMLPTVGHANGARLTPLEPRIWQVDFASEALKRDMRFLVILPGNRDDSKKLPVLYILHGRGRDETTLLQDEFCRRQLLVLNCAVVLPLGLDGWYMDSPVEPADRFASYLDEVMAAAESNFPLRTDGAGRAITNWSMGGYGAAYTFCRRPNDFAALATIIGIIDYPRRDIDPPSLNYPVQPRFGSDEEVWRSLNPRLLLSGLKPRPVMVAYAEDAPERQMNEVFIATARSSGFAVREMRVPGGHTFPAVRETLPAVLGFLELQLNPVAHGSQPVRP